MKPFYLAMILALAAPALSRAEPAAGLGLDASAKSLLAERSLADLGSADARRSIRGTKDLWIQLSIQQPGVAPTTASLAADLKTTDLEGTLRDAGFRVMDPDKRSLAMGLRPTLVLTVLFAPKNTEGNSTDFYLVVAKATQDVTPLGGDRLTMATWMSAGQPIASHGDGPKDAEAIRASARVCIAAFIAVAHDKDVAPAPKL